MPKPPKSTTRFAPADIVRFQCRPVVRERERRGSAAERGYDHEWTKLSVAHRKREPLCRICGFRGIVTAVQMVNHTIPIRHRPDLRLDRNNLSSSCFRCHDTVIRDLERRAEEMNDIMILQSWLQDPATWPEEIAFEAERKPRLRK